MIINLTQHVSAPEQGAVEPADKAGVVKLITFSAAPTAAEMRERAAALAQIAVSAGAEAAMIGGAPYFGSALENALRAAGVRPLYAFSVRESVERTLPDGTVRKEAVFRHAGWVEPV